VSRDDAIQVEGTVIEVLPNKMVRVELANGHSILARVSGRMRLNFIRLSPGDTVTVEMSPYDLSKGCIIERNNEVIS
jgi:translation initiation factor IF-1